MFLTKEQDKTLEEQLSDMEIYLKNFWVQSNGWKDDPRTQEKNRCTGWEKLQEILNKELENGSSRCGATETNPTRNHEVRSLASLSGLRIWRC